MKNFFKKIVDFVKEATWLQPILFVALILVLLFSIRGIGNLVDKANNLSCSCNKDEDKIYTKILAEDVLEKIENGDNFVLYIGYESCTACQAFQPVLKRYAKDYPNEKIYYLSIQTNDEGEYKDATLTTDLLNEIYAPIKKVLQQDLATPTVAAIKNGKCVDAKVGGGTTGITVSDLVDLQSKVKNEE